MKVKYYMVKTVDGHVVRITARKPPKRDRLGHFAGKGGGRCRRHGALAFCGWLNDTSAICGIRAICS